MGGPVTTSPCQGVHFVSVQPAPSRGPAACLPRTPHPSLLPLQASLPVTPPASPAGTGMDVPLCSSPHAPVGAVLVEPPNCEPSGSGWVARPRWVTHRAHLHCPVVLPSRCGVCQCAPVTLAPAGFFASHAPCKSCRPSAGTGMDVPLCSSPHAPVEAVLVEPPNCEPSGSGWVARPRWVTHRAHLVSPPPPPSIHTEHTHTHPVVTPLDYMRAQGPKASDHPPSAVVVMCRP